MGAEDVSRPAAQPSVGTTRDGQPAPKASSRVWPVGAVFLVASLALYGLIAVGLFKLIATVT